MTDKPDILSLEIKRFFEMSVLWREGRRMLESNTTPMSKDVFYETLLEVSDELQALRLHTTSDSLRKSCNKILRDVGRHMIFGGARA